MKQYINFPTLSSRSYERLGWLLALGAAIVAVLIVVWLSPVELGHVVLAVAALVALIGIVFVWRRKLWRKLKIRLPHKQVPTEAASTATAPSPYYSREELSEITKKYSGLTDRELEKVLYDEHHHWPVTWAMIINPFWSRDHDIQPSVSKNFSDAQSGGGNSFMIGTLRVVIRLVQLVYVLTIVSLAGALTNLPFIGTAISGSTKIVVSIIVILITVVWVMYMRHVARGCRLIVTDWIIIMLVHQLPWRDNKRTLLQYKLYASSDPQQTVAGKLFGYIDLSLSTIDPEEPLPGWIKARKPKKLKLVMNGWDARKRQEQADAYGDELPSYRPVDVDDTQEIPVVLS